MWTLGRKKWGKAEYVKKRREEVCFVCLIGDTGGGIYFNGINKRGPSWAGHRWLEHVLLVSVCRHRWPTSRGGGHGRALRHQPSSLLNSPLTVGAIMAGTVKKCAVIKSLDVITKMISKAAFDAEVSSELVSKRAACDWPRFTQNIVVDAWQRRTESAVGLLWTTENENRHKEELFSYDMCGWTQNHWVNVFGLAWGFRISDRNGHNLSQTSIICTWTSRCQSRFLLSV